MKFGQDGRLHYDIDTSSTEDFRGVIDDLTVENKKLKRKLKTYQKLQDSHLKDQKLFEVRVHGLPVDKKRELEEMLRLFAMRLDNRPTRESVNAYSSVAPALPPRASASSLASTSNNLADSAYVSGSASGQGSSAQSATDRYKMPSEQSSKSRRQNIHSYLHDIPAGLMPQNPSAMTERSKKKLVVRRLEQIFAGNLAAVSGHQQHLQQQEVSQIAARADRSAMEAQGHSMAAEGTREARIIAHEKDDLPKPIPEATQHLDSKIKIDEQDFASKEHGSGSPDQRPTRPLDLDPQRAQVPADNFYYMRHLGFSPPGIESMASPIEDHGWIYLNILINMAQLHIFNVTTEFVTKALEAHSQKFELSSDGRKVRWKGGKQVTMTSSDGGDTPSLQMGASGEDRGSPRKRLKRSHLSSNSGSSNLRTGRQEPDNRLAYTPLFQHRDTDGGDTSASEDDELAGSPFPAPGQGESSGATSSGVRTNLVKRKARKDTGPIIFYNNARFCTDLSGDPGTEDVMLYNAFLYHGLGAEPVGIANPGQDKLDVPSETRGPLDQARILPEPMHIDDNPIPEDLELAFPEQSPLSDQSGQHPRTYDLEASGIGGVCPADNFAINVQSTHSKIDNGSTVSNEPVTSKWYPDSITGILKANSRGRTSRPAYHKQVLLAKHQTLPPSRLPPASCFMAFGESPQEDGSDEEDDDDTMSDWSGSADVVPAAAPQPINVDYASDETEGESDEDYDDSESDGSLDLLAIARQLDPEAIRAQEREYDANMAERLQAEIPAGSSAATAGGGSGFASPANGVTPEDIEAAKKAQREAHARNLGKASLGKKRASFAMAGGLGSEATT